MELVWEVPYARPPRTAPAPMCRRCNVGLVVWTEAGVRVWQHYVPPDDDHEAEPTPARGVREICDFCITDVPRGHGVTYFSEPFGLAYVDFNGDVVAHMLDECWLACGECRTLIEANNRMTLAQRSLKPQVHGMTSGQRARVWARVRFAQELFFSKRVGDAVADVVVG